MMKQQSLWSESPTYRWTLVGSAGCLGALVAGVAGALLLKVGSVWSNAVLVVLAVFLVVTWIAHGMVLLRLGTEKRLTSAERSRFRWWLMLFGILVVPELISSIRLGREQDQEANDS